MPTGYAVRARLQAIAAIEAAPSASDKAALHKEICAAVDQLKAMGWPVERIIIRVKDVAREVGLLRHADLSGGEALLEEAIRWCIDQYYAT